MRQRGTHTFEIYLRYHRCPACGYILESREDFHDELGHRVKDLVCPRCSHAYRIEKSGGGPIGPLFGNPPKPEFDWS